jgi:hypothetical protein
MLFISIVRLLSFDWLVSPIVAVELCQSPLSLRADSLDAVPAQVVPKSADVL